MLAPPACHTVHVLARHTRAVSRRISHFTSLLLVALLASPALADAPIDFARDVRPLLSENCFQCHGPDANQRQADLRLDTADGAAGLLTAGDRDSSELFRRLLSDDADEVMPPPDSNRRLTAEQIETLGRWIDQGAAWGEHWSFAPLVAPPLPDLPSPEAREAIEPATAAAAGEATTAKNLSREVNPIDRFVRHVWAEEQVAGSPPAPPETRLRRVTLDLTGLPPTLHELDAFLLDPSPEAYARAVDRLLQSPAFGERMAWDWLDAARYADSNGYQGDGERTMWPWRDWVVDAFNRNLPFDRFTLWQVAGDLLPDATQEQRLASGFFRNHMINGEGGRIAEENRIEYVFDMTETLGTVWLGLTLNCCRCHDHKFDPLTQADYYQLFDYFNQTPVNGGGGNPQTPPVLEVPSDDQQQEIENLSRHLAELRRNLADREQELKSTAETEPETEPQPEDEPEAAAANEAAVEAPAAADPAAEAAAKLAAKLAADPQHQKWVSQIEATEKQLAAARGAIPRVMIMGDQPQRRETFVLRVGLYNQPLEKVSADVPGFLPRPAEDAPANRLGLARWLIDDANPLTARVVVNRFWQSFFGIGLVKTPEDFGVQGEIPRHRELLDWLAADFRDNGWDVKRLVRQIVTSDAYQQSSRVTPDEFERDPENRLLARGPRRRLPAWMLRDQALAIGGLLAPRVGGKPVNGYQPPGIWEEATFGKKRYVQDRGEALHRRTLYTFWRRIIAPTMLFDNAPRQVCSVSPLLTNTPLHALTTLNETTYIEAARGLAQRALAYRDPLTPPAADENPADDSAAIAWAFRSVTSRRPEPAEVEILTERLATLRTEFTADAEAAQRLLAIGESPQSQRWDSAELAAWTALASLLLNLDETVTKP
ncbi:MAG: DUF1553 domain-containing protein [Planctomycetaceae bacterium]|nr:MAG: DUF1553 domain-containing protein [Planctomycetaceae bacterium]